MPTPLADMIARIRNDLHDNDATAYRWTDAVLQRHVERAVKEFSYACPLQQKTTVQTAAGSRQVDLNPGGVASLPNMVYVEKVEYPVDYYPPVYCRWQLWNDVLYLIVDDEPDAVADVYVYWGKVHSITASATTLPANYEPVVETGAAAYALLEWANFAPNRVNVGGEEVWKDYLVWGQDRLKAFKEALDKLDYRRKLRVRQLYPF